MPTPTPHQQLSQMLIGYWTSQALHVAAKLGLADLLAQGPRDSDALAAETRTHPRALYRLLRMLASLGIFREIEGCRFALTPLAEYLRSDAPETVRPMALMMGGEHFQAWAKLEESIRTGETAFELAFGTPLFDYLAHHPEQAAVFDAAMTAIHGRETRAMLDAYDLAGVGSLADLGGGNGSTLRGVLDQYPNLQGILFDLPGVIGRARSAPYLKELGPRCRFVEGSFFESVVEGADVYLLRHIIHDWDDDESATILRNVRRAMTPRSKVLVVESVIAPGNDPSFAKLLDLNMLVMPGGVERTEAEYRVLFDQAGLRISRIVPTATEVSVIEGVIA